MSVSGANGASSYSYDANGLRWSSSDNGITARFLLDGNSVLEDLDGSNNLKTSYLWDPKHVDSMVSFRQGGATYFPLTDALGSIVGVTDVSGSVVQTASYEVFGTRTIGGGGPQLRYGYTTREHDLFGGIFNRDRTHDGRGRWLQADRLASVIYSSDTAGAVGTQIPAQAWRFTASIGREMGAKTQITNAYAYANPPTLLTDPTGFCAGGAAEDWFGAPLFFGEVGFGPVAGIVFGGIYTGLSTGSQIAILSLLVETGAFATEHGFDFTSFGAEVGVGFGEEDNVAGLSGFTSPHWGLEGVIQFGPLIWVTSTNGSSLFVGSELAIGTGALFGPPQATWGWEL